MKADRTIRVLTMADERYAMPLAVMGRSLLEQHRSGRPLLLQVIDDGLTAATRERLERSWEGASPSPATWTFVAPYYSDAERLPVWGRVPALTYTRLFLDHQFEGCGGRAVVLDSDTLVLADVAELSDTELHGNVLGACVDPFIPTMGDSEGLPAAARGPIGPDAPYFNAGVMVADLPAWRGTNVGPRAMAYIEAHYRQLRQYDQDALNFAAFGAWQQLDERWNAHPRLANALGRRFPTNPAIVHFSGRLKPWLYDGGTAMDRLYFEVLRRTEWRDFKTPRGWRALAWRVYDSPLRRLLHGTERRILAAQREANVRWLMR